MYIDGRIILARAELCNNAFTPNRDFFDVNETFVEYEQVVRYQHAIAPTVSFRSEHVEERRCLCIRPAVNPLQGLI